MTIQDLATHLGLAKGTVSRALNNYSDISRDTRTRVQKAARDLGYAPSMIAQAVRTGKVKSIGLVLNVERENAQKPFLSDFLDGISRRLGEEGWTLTVATAFSSDKAVELHRQLLTERKVDGFILPRTRVSDARVALMRTYDMPFVMFGRTGDNAGAAWFDFSGEDAMRLAVRRLANFGHRRIAYIGASDTYNFEGLRRAGFARGMKEAGLSHLPAQIVAGAMSEEEGADLALTLLREPAPPTALVCAVDRSALGALHTISQLGLVAGRDVSVIGYDGIPQGAYANPPLTTFSVDNQFAGRSLASLLMQCINGEAPETLRQLAHADLVERHSDGPPGLTSEEIATHVTACNNSQKQ